MGDAFVQRTVDLVQAQGRPPMPGMHPQSGTLQQPPQ